MYPIPIYRCINWLSKPVFLSRLTKEFEGICLDSTMACFLYVLLEVSIISWECKKLGLSSGQIMVVSPQFEITISAHLPHETEKHLISQPAILIYKPTWNVRKERTLLISNHDLRVFHSLTSCHISFPSYNHLGTATIVRNCCWKSCTASYSKLQQHLQFSRFSVWFLLGEQKSANEWSPFSLSDECCYLHKSKRQYEKQEMEMSTRETLSPQKGHVGNWFMFRDCKHCWVFQALWVRIIQFLEKTKLMSNSLVKLTQPETSTRKFREFQPVESSNKDGFSDPSHQSEILTMCELYIFPPFPCNLFHLSHLRRPLWWCQHGDRLHPGARRCIASIATAFTAHHLVSSLSERNEARIWWGVGNQK